MDVNCSIRVGFGPITTSNSFYQSGMKVAREIDKDHRFVCGYFHWQPFLLEEMLGFDVLVFIKYYPELAVLWQLHRLGKRMILDYQDMFLYKSVYELKPLKKALKRVAYARYERCVRNRLRLMDLCFAPSPVVVGIAREAGVRPHFLQRQLYNDRNEYHYRDHDIQPRCVVVYWTGVCENLSQNEPVLPVLERLHRNHGCRIVYSTNAVGDLPFVEYRQWNRDTWEDELTEVDIAFRWRDTSSLQRCKDANKVMAYMGAALPAVIYPTESEKLVVEDGVTGFFAHTVDEFEERMVALVRDKELRKRVGMAAHKEVWSKYSLRAQVEEIKKVILSLV